MKKNFYKAEFNYENVPDYLKKCVSKKFMEHYNEIVDLFNERIDEVNSSWETTGKPFAFGDYVEDINPEYAKYIRDHIQPVIDEANKRFHLCKYRIGPYGDINGYVPFIKDSRIWVMFKPVELG